MQQLFRRGGDLGEAVEALVEGGHEGLRLGHQRVCGRRGQCEHRRAGWYPCGGMGDTWERVRGVRDHDPTALPRLEIVFYLPEGQGCVSQRSAGAVHGTVDRERYPGG